LHCISVAALPRCRPHICMSLHWQHGHGIWNLVGDGRSDSLGFQDLPMLHELARYWWLSSPFVAIDSSNVSLAALILASKFSNWAWAKFPEKSAALGQALDWHL
jgi:hypothetical protein